MSKSIFIAMILGITNGVLLLTLVAPILPIQLKEIDFDQVLLGYIFTAYALASAVTTLIGGAIIHITGRKIILIVSVFGMGVCSILFSFIALMNNRNLIISVCFIIRIIEGISSGFIYCAVDSVIVIIFKERQVEYISYITTAEAVAVMIGPAIGSFFYDLFGFQMVFLSVAVFNFLGAIAITFLIPKSVDINDQTLELENEQNQVVDIYNQSNNFINKESIRSDEMHYSTQVKCQDENKYEQNHVSYLGLCYNPIIFLTSIVSFIAFFEYCYLEPILTLRLSDMGLSQSLIGAFFGIQGISYTIASLFTSYVSDLLGTKRTLWISMFLGGLTHFMVGPSNFLPDNVIIMGFGQFFNVWFEAFFLVMGLPILIKQGEQMYPKHRLVVADMSSGIVNGMCGLGEAIGPIYGSYMTTLFGFRNTADSIALMLIVYSIIYFLAIKYLSLNKTKKDSTIDIDKEANKIDIE